MSLTHPRNIFLVVLQIGKAKDLSALLHTLDLYLRGAYFTSYPDSGFVVVILSPALKMQGFHLC
jgi:hypothetical protein